MTKSLTRKIAPRAAVHAAALALLCLPVACRGGNDAATSRAPVTLVVAAASDLAAAAPELANAFETETGNKVEITFGSSGQLAQQILNGAPVDVFASADRGWIERLREAQRIVAGSEAVYARGRVVIFVIDTTLHFRQLTDLQDSRVTHVAIANPEHAPYGRAAKQALTAAGIWRTLERRVVIAENVRQTVQLAETGNVTASITALSLMRHGAGSWTLVPEELHVPLLQVMTAIGGRPHEREASTFVKFVLGEEGRKILARYKFVLPTPADTL